MRKTFYSVLLLLYCTTVLQAQPEQKTDNKKFQTQITVTLPIKDFGPVYDVPFATDKPDPNLAYKILFEASMEPMDSSQIYPPLELAARMYNLHVYGGVPQKNLDVVLVIGGNGIPAAMNNAAFKKKYGRDNPNLKILAELNEAGVQIKGCAQAMMKHHIDPTEMNPLVTPIFSRMTTVSTYQLKGYAYFRF